MTNRERFLAVLNGKTPDRLPVIEWASWWQKTLDQWEAQGMPAGMDYHQLFAYFGEDDLYQFWMDHKQAGFPIPKQHGHPIMYDEADYKELKKIMYSFDEYDEKTKKR